MEHRASPRYRYPSQVAPMMWTWETQNKTILRRAAAGKAAVVEARVVPMAVVTGVRGRVTLRGQQPRPDRLLANRALHRVRSVPPGRVPLGRAPGARKCAPRACIVTYRPGGCP